jgi:hypothetical protein
MSRNSRCPQSLGDFRIEIPLTAYSQKEWPKSCTFRAEACKRYALRPQNISWEPSFSRGKGLLGNDLMAPRRLTTQANLPNAVLPSETTRLPNQQGIRLVKVVSPEVTISPARLHPATAL